VREQKGGIIKLEGRLEYVARRFSEMEERITQIEKENEIFKEKLKNIEELISKENKTDKTDNDD
jgi:phage regulator Rha-like protein